MICVFDGAGAARLLIAWLGSAHPDVEGTAADLRRIVDETPPNSRAETGLPFCYVSVCYSLNHI
ncbi:MAG: hypothetical protein WAU56_12835 [Steroidobacteraceae bacterium]